MLHINVLGSFMVLRIEDESNGTLTITVQVGRVLLLDPNLLRRFLSQTISFAEEVTSRNQKPLPKPLNGS
jgi:hypothetical protein